jgi:hypothetical protein
MELLFSFKQINLFIFTILRRRKAAAAFYYWVKIKVQTAVLHFGESARPIVEYLNARCASLPCDRLHRSVQAKVFERQERKKMGFYCYKAKRFFKEKKK